MPAAAAMTPIDLRRRRQAAGLLVVAAVMQLVGQVLLRVPTTQGPGSGTWAAAHMVLVLSAVSLLAGMALVALVTGPGVATWLGLAVLVVGQALTLAVLVIDLDLAAAPVDVIRTLDTWDFLAVAGAVVLVLELRRRRGSEPGADLALVALAVPALDELVLVAAAAVVLGFTVLAHSLVTGRARSSSGWLAVGIVVAYALAGAVSWQRAALALVVLAWTVHHLRTRNPAPVAA